MGNISIKLIQVDDLGTVKNFGVVFDQLRAAFEVFNHTGFFEQHDPFRLTVLEGRRQKLACCAGLNHEPHQAALRSAGAGLMASSVSFTLLSLPATTSNSQSQITPPSGHEFLRCCHF